MRASQNSAPSTHRIHLENDVILNPLSKLTKREKECLELYLVGKTAKETAQMLILSPRTVEEHFNNIKAKLGYTRKRQLLVFSRGIDTMWL